MNNRLRSIIRKEFIHIFRDKRTLAIILIIPILQLFLLGYAATNDIRTLMITGDYPSDRDLAEVARLPAGKPARRPGAPAHFKRQQ